MIDASRYEHAVALSELADEAQRLSERHASWHFHIVTESCSLTAGADPLLFVVEDDAERRVLVAPAAENDLTLGQVLARLVHGDEVLDADPHDLADVEDATVRSEILEIATSASRRRVPWHHHLLYPKCAFNPRPGSWTFVIEVDGRVTKETFADEPRALLATIEQLFYGQHLVG